MTGRRRNALRIAAFCMAGIFLFSGCGNKGNAGQDQEFVYRKEEASGKENLKESSDSEKLAENEELQETSAEAEEEREKETESATMQALRKSLNVPDTLSENVTAEGGWPCTVNAAVTMNGMEKPEIITLGERNWDEDKTLEYAENLLQGEKVYQRREEDTDRIIEYRQTMSSLEEALRDYDVKTEQEKTILEQQLQNTEKQYLEFIKTCERQYDDISENRLYDGYSGYVDWNAGTMEIIVMPGNSQIWMEYEELLRNKKITCNLSEETAVSIGYGYLEKMGLAEGMECVACEKTPNLFTSTEYYYIKFCEPEKGAELSWWGAGPVVYMKMSDQGLLELTALGKYTVEDRKETELLDFEKIWEIYMDYLPEYSISSVEITKINVTEFRLGYYRSGEEDMIVPAWYALGDIEEILEDEETGERKEFIQEALIGKVNAVTGEVIGPR